MRSGNRAKTFVLLHGAWHGAWCWDAVKELLEIEGHRVICPTQTGLGERCHLLSRAITLEVFVNDIVNILAWRDLEDISLVGHSLGASVALGVADRIPERIADLIFLDGVLLRDGESPLGLLPPSVAEARMKQAQDSSGGISIPAPPATVFGIDDPDLAAAADLKLTPQPLGTYTSPLKLTHSWGNGIPMTYIACVRPKYLPVQASQTRAVEAGMRFLTLEAGHDAMMTAPVEVVRLLDA